MENSVPLAEGGLRPSGEFDLRPARCACRRPIREAMGDSRCLLGQEARRSCSKSARDQRFDRLAKPQKEPLLVLSGNDQKHEENHGVFLPSDARICPKRKDCMKSCMHW